MENRLRSSLQSSASDFLASALNHPLRSSRSSLKLLVHSITPSSSLASDIPPSLHSAISHSLLSFRSPDHSSGPSPSTGSPVTPPSKRARTRTQTRTRTRARASPSKTPKKTEAPLLESDKLQVLAYVTSLCLSHPKGVFTAADILPSVQSLHDSLVLFESHPSLSSEIASLCESFWKENIPGRETLISQSLPFLISRSLTLKRKTDVHRVYSLRDAFNLFDFEDESIEDLKMLLIRCVISPVYLKSEEGRKFLGFMLGLSRQLLKEGLEMVKSQIPFGRKSSLEGYGEVLFRTWKGADGELRVEMEDGLLMALVEGAIHAGSRAFAGSIRRVLGGFVVQRVTDGVEKLLFRLAEPIIFRSLQVANSNVRLNALHLLLDLFPLEDPDSTKEVKDTLLEKQFFLMERLLMDDCPDIRVAAVEGCCRVLHLFWEVLPTPTITKTLTKIFADMSHDISSVVRLSTLNGIAYLLGNPQSREILKVLLPRLGHLIADNVLSNRVALVDLLLELRDLRNFQFNKVVGLDELLKALANDESQVAQMITRLLIPSYFPTKVSIEEACNRCLTLMRRSPLAGARFCEFAASEGASPNSLLELVKVLIKAIDAHDKLGAEQIEGFILASAYLCQNLVDEQSHRNALQRLFSEETVKSLFAAASTHLARSSVLNILSTVSPVDMGGIVEKSLHMVVNCSGLPQNLELQNEVRSAHKLLVSCDHFDDMFEALTQFVQKAAFRCHIKFGIELAEPRVSPGKKRKTKSSVKGSGKWRHVYKKKTTNFDEDYSTAVGISWQIKDLLASDDTREAVLKSQALELAFLALKVISEVAILHCNNSKYTDTCPVSAYAALALHMTLEDINVSCLSDSGSKKNRSTEPSTSHSETVLDQTTAHLLNCMEKLLHDNNSFYGCGTSDSDSVQEEVAPKKSKDGFLHTKQKSLSNQTKMFTSVLKFVVDSAAMGHLSCSTGRCLKLTTTYLKHMSLTLRKMHRDNLQFNEDVLKEICLCLKSCYGYGAKLLNLILREANESSPPPDEACGLVNEMLCFVSSVELYLGSGQAARLVAAIKSWLPDLVLALVSQFLLQPNQAESPHLIASHQLKLHFPSWISVLVTTALCKTQEENTEEDARDSESEEFPVFGKLIEMIVSLLKGTPQIQDAIGMILLASSGILLEGQNYEMFLGLLHFICVTLVGPENREWSEFNMMLSLLSEIYPRIEKEAEEQDNEDVQQKLSEARSLLEPVWLYHVYETGRFSMTEEE